MSDGFSFETRSANSDATLEKLLDRLDAQEEASEVPSESTGHEIYSEANPAMEQERGGFRPRFHSAARRRPEVATRGTRLGWRPPWRFHRYGVGYGPAATQHTLWAQACLAKLVETWVPQTGVIDEGTRRAIATFQEHKHLPVTGFLDNETSGALDQACSEANDPVMFEQEWENPPMQTRTRTEPVIEGPRIFFKRNSLELRQDARVNSMVHFVHAFQRIHSFLKQKGATGHVTLHGVPVPREIRAIMSTFLNEEPNGSAAP